MLSKLIYLAPVAFTTAGVTALISLKIEDERTKRVLRLVAVVLALGSVVSFVQQASELVETLARAERTISEQRGLLEVERAKAAEAVRRATEAQLATKDATIASAANEQRTKAQLVEDLRKAQIRLDQVEQEAAARKAEIERLIRDAQRLEVLRQAENTGKLEREKQAIAKEATNYCNQCCGQQAPRIMPESRNAVGVCISECTEQKSSNWFGQNVILCRR